jgi:hypothetical protein
MNVCVRALEGGRVAMEERWVWSGDNTWRKVKSERHVCGDSEDGMRIKARRDSSGDNNARNDDQRSFKKD